MTKTRFLLIISFSFSMISIQSQTTFGDQNVIMEDGTTGRARSIFIADLDGDGDMDLITASEYDHKIAWYENLDGIGTFGYQTVISTDALGAFSVNAADLDGDGDFDVVSTSSEDGKIAWYENLDGDGTFGPQQVISVEPATEIKACLADIDGDGDVDIVYSLLDENIIAWYENLDGSGSFGSQQIILSDAYSVIDIFVCDLDGDGDNDILSGCILDNNFSWCENLDGSGTFGSQQLISDYADGPTFVNAADLDGDGDLDAISSSYTDGIIAWYENVDGNFGVQQLVSDNENSAGMIIAADIDNDNDMDLIACSTEDNHISCYENIDGNGNFGARQIVFSPIYGVRDLIVYDIDNDGDNDLFSASYWDSNIAWYENIDGLGTFGPQQPITYSAFGAKSVYASDIDGDGDMDVLSASWMDNKIAWYENIDGFGAFGPQIVISTEASYAESIFSADIDTDGDMDVLSASYGDNKIAWYENIDGFGVFGPQQIISTDTYLPTSVFSADLDGDGDMDVLSASWMDNKVAWYRNIDGHGNFGAQEIISTNATNATSIHADDIDGDGDLDVISSSLYGIKIAWYENLDGNGSFGAQNLVTTNVIEATSVYCADLDNDGDIDVISASRGDNKIAWYENLDGAGNFGSQNLISANAIEAQFVYCADLDNDGDKDVISASKGDNKIAWYENTDGLGSFSSQQIISTNVNQAYSVFAADLDGDEDLEVLSASYQDSKIAWYKNLLVTEIEKIQQDAMVVFPNPTNGILTIDNNGSINWVRITDIMGKIVFQSSGQSINKKSDQIDLSGFESGIYLIRIQTDNGLLIERIIKN